MEALLSVSMLTASSARIHLHFVLLLLCRSKMDGDSASLKDGPAHEAQNMMEGW